MTARRLDPSEFARWPKMARQAAEEWLLARHRNDEPAMGRCERIILELTGVDYPRSGVFGFAGWVFPPGWVRVPKDFTPDIPTREEERHAAGKRVGRASSPRAADS